MPNAYLKNEYLDCLIWLSLYNQVDYNDAFSKIREIAGLSKADLNNALGRRKKVEDEAKKERKASSAQNRKPKGDALVMRLVGNVNADGDDNSGVFHNRFNAGNPIEVRICEPIWVDDLTCTEDGNSHGRVYGFNKLNGEEVKITIPMALLSGTCEEFKKILLSKGFIYESTETAYLISYLMSRVPGRSRLIQTHIGWNKSHTSFVLPNKTIGDVELLYQPENISADKGVETSGDFAVWKAMAKLCEKNPIFGLALCVNLSGPLLELVNAESGGAHIYSGSSSGKSTALCVGSSIWGRGEVGYFPKSWASTLVGMMAAAAASLSGTCLNLDEVGSATIDIGLVAYILGNNADKEMVEKNWRRNTNSALEHTCVLNG